MSIQKMLLSTSHKYAKHETFNLLKECERKVLKINLKLKDEVRSFLQPYHSSTHEIISISK